MDAKVIIFSFSDNKKKQKKITKFFITVKSDKFPSLFTFL